ncbi:MAG: MFS transporter, partial [Vicinamibacteria bacterium]
MGSAVSQVGFWVQKVGVGWLTWELTESGTWLGIVALADALPITLLGPLSGAIADRVERIRMMRITLLAQSLEAAMLAVLSLAGILHIEVLVALVLSLGLIQAFDQPVRLSLVPSLVQLADLSPAVALNSSLFNLARFVGPAIAGVLITTSGVGISFAVAALCFLFFLWVMYRIQPLRNEVHAGPRPGLLREVLDGLRYAAAHPAIRPVLVIVLASNVFSRSFLELLPAFSDVVFHRGADGLAILVASVGVGALVSSLWLAGRGHPTGLTRIGVRFLLVLALSQIAFAWTSRFLLATFWLGAVGFATVATSISCQTLLQHAVDGHMRGRVMSLYGMVFRAGPALGA